MAEKFTDKMIEKLKPQAKIVDIRERDGFGVRVLPSGVKTWFYIYRFDGKRRFLNLGHYPLLSLAEARKKHREALLMVEHGVDPLHDKVVKRLERQQTPTVEEFAREYFKAIESDPRYQLKSWSKVASVLRKEVLPALRKLKITDVTPRHLLLVTDAVVERKALVMANRVFAFASMLMNHAVEKRVLDANPFRGMKRPGGKEQGRDRVLTPAEIKMVWTNLAACNMTDEIRRAIKLVLVTAQRPGEVIGMHSSEIEGAWWTIPKERSKNGREHRVYLTATALSLLGDMSGKGYVFKTVLKGEKPMTQLAMNYAIRRALAWPLTDAGGNPLYQKSGKPATENRLGVDSFTPHDLRRTAATHMSQMGFSDEVIDAVLNHKKQGIIKVYNRNKYDIEKQQALEA